MTLKLKFYSEGYVEVLDIAAPRPLLFEDSHAVRRFLFRGHFFFCPEAKRYGQLVNGVASWTDEDAVPKSAVAELSKLVSVPDRDDIEERILTVWVADASEGLIAANPVDGAPLDLSVEFGHVRQVVNQL